MNNKNEELLHDGHWTGLLVAASILIAIIGYDIVKNRNYFSIATWILLGVFIEMIRYYAKHLKKI